MTTNSNTSMMLLHQIGNSEIAGLLSMCELPDWVDVERLDLALPTTDLGQDADDEISEALQGLSPDALGIWKTELDRYVSQGYRLKVFVFKHESPEYRVVNEKPSRLEKYVRRLTYSMLEAMKKQPFNWPTIVQVAVFRCRGKEV